MEVKIIDKCNKHKSKHKGLDSSSQIDFLQTKIDRLCEMIQTTFISLEYYKNEDLFSHSVVNTCSETLRKLYINVSNISANNENFDKSVEELQQILNRLSSIFSTVGTKYMDDILYVVFGREYTLLQSFQKEKYLEIDNAEVLFKSKIALIETFVWSIGYRVKSWNEVSPEFSNIQCLDKITDATNDIDMAHHLDCFEPSKLYSSLHHSAYGLRIVIHNTKERKTLILHGFVENIPIQCLDNEPYVKNKLIKIREIVKNKYNSECDTDLVERWIDTFTLKDILINSENDFIKRYDIVMNDIRYIKSTHINVVIKRFLSMDNVSKRKMLINLLLYNKDSEVQYVAYLLYDLIGSSSGKQNSIEDIQESVDNIEQIQIYNSFPWMIKQYFKESMTHTMQYTQSAFSPPVNTKISLEQQILLLRSSEIVKEKAIAKFKDIKNKSDDQGSKTKQYLEALVRIPFGNIRREPILDKPQKINTQFIHLNSLIQSFGREQLYNIPKKQKYTMYEIQHYIDKISQDLFQECKNYVMSVISSLKNAALIQIIKKMENTEKYKTKNEMVKIITQSVNRNPYAILESISSTISLQHQQNNILKSEIDKLRGIIVDLDQNIEKISEHLDNSIYGHTEAKTQILKIIGQWINGEQKGYCFGFEGSPGIGKTSLAKRGLAQCLQDEDGVSRPFSFIALGGSSNGSTLDGHNFTYVNSTWGKIVDILMDSQCMNPIIYIDELDKVSKTEQGKEIIGILMHLIDTTQNDEFQDKYFSGIPLDLSKALFIFSYNDPEQIDRILLDRIHRIKFDNLSWKDKVVITKKFILNELNTKMGFENVVELSDEVIEYIIVTYTSEAGIRHLKEILFDLYGEINLELLHRTYSSIDKIHQFPLHINVCDLGTKYLKKYKKYQHKEIHKKAIVGIINGMWANSLGNGGIIPIEVVFFPTSSFLELRLTGLQGDVMKESMNVAKSVAWSLTDEAKQIEYAESFSKTRNQGIHIHCPEGSVNKDGPSAGAAITLAIYSRLNNILIRNDAAITGEINLQGDIMAIGGLEAKILGSIRAGIKTIVYPESNQPDFEDFKTKYQELLDDITFVSISHIREALPLFMVIE